MSLSAHLERPVRFPSPMKVEVGLHPGVAAYLAVE